MKGRVMTDETGRPTSAAPQNPKGIFDRSMLGFRIEPIPVEISRDRLTFFARTIGETNPIYFDVDAARAAGHPDVVAPPTFAFTIDRLAKMQSERLGRQCVDDVMNFDLARLLHGGERYDYHGLVYAGDEVIFAEEVVGFEDKKGGLLEFAHFEKTISHATRGVLITARRSLVHTLG